MDSNEPPTKYVIKVGQNVNSTNFEDSCCEVIEDDLFGSSTLDPINGGSVKDIYIRYTYFKTELNQPYLSQHPQIQSNNHASYKEKTVVGCQMDTHSRQIGLIMNATKVTEKY